MNENKYNSEKMKNSGFKALLKPLMKLIKKRTKRSVPAKTYDTSYEDQQNNSNESLERQIIEEMQQCAPGSAIFVYEGNDTCNIVPVSRDNFYVPVHFARTEAGTFFWTSTSKTEGDFATAHCYTECQTAEQQYPVYVNDRWVQA